MIRRHHRPQQHARGRLRHHSGGRLRRWSWRVHKLLAYLLIDVVNGLASAICMGPMRTIIQTEADEKMVGRVFGLDTTLSTLGMPLGMLIFAPLADVIPISLVFIIGGVLTLPIGIYLFGQARRNVSAQVTRTAA